MPAPPEATGGTAHSGRALAHSVTPAQAGVHAIRMPGRWPWIPACAGMTNEHAPGSSIRPPGSSVRPPGSSIRAPGRSATARASSGRALAHSVTPAQAGVHAIRMPGRSPWIPACAGMTNEHAPGSSVRPPGSSATARASSGRALAHSVTPAQAGVHAIRMPGSSPWIPACAGMTNERVPGRSATARASSGRAFDVLGLAVATSGGAAVPARRAPGGSLVFNDVAGCASRQAGTAKRVSLRASRGSHRASAEGTPPTREGRSFTREATPLTRHARGSRSHARGTRCHARGSVRNDCCAGENVIAARRVEAVGGGFRGGNRGFDGDKRGGTRGTRYQPFAQVNPRRGIRDFRGDAGYAVARTGRRGERGARHSRRRGGEVMAPGSLQACRMRLEASHD